ncbi:ABC transporter permease [Streptosporangium canum]|uniref:ABC transporter permease n=1 Tax=Streptosporangium canum TaxID=324952 RepID=UPI0036BA61DD
MIATFRYEFRMQIRRPVLWIVYGLTFAVTVAAFGHTYLDLNLGGDEGRDPRLAMIASASLLTSLLPIVYGCLLADRLVRDRRLGMSDVLDTTPAGRTGRLAGKYLGVCAATAVPLVLAYLGRAVAYAVTEGEPAALGWAAVVLVTAVVPALLFVGALALAGPLLMPPLLFRVLFVVYWFWGSIITPSMMPTVSHSILSANSQYVAYGLLGYGERILPDAILPPGGFVYGPWPGAALNFLRPEASPAVALLWIGVMIALAAAVLLLTRLHTARTES